MGISEIPIVEMISVQVSEFRTVQVTYSRLLTSTRKQGIIRNSAGRSCIGGEGVRLGFRRERFANTGSR